MADNDVQSKWDQRYRAATSPPRAAAVLREHVALLPTQGLPTQGLPIQGLPIQGRALDLACGRGGNALLLAQAGLLVDAWDISPVAIEQLQRLARTQGLPVTAEVRDVIASPPPVASYDVIVVSYFLERALAPALIAALRKGGLLFYQTFGPARVAGCGPRNPAYRLQPGELPRLFAPLQTLLQQDNVATGEVQWIGRCLG